MVVPKPKLIIAGPGAGKTYEMVQEITNALNNLKSNRILAAITYTNAATDSIKSRLYAQSNIPRNVFIGTTYSFFCQFILLPYGTLCSQIGIDKLFLNVDIQSIIESQPQSKAKDFAARKATEKRLLKSMLDKGQVPIEQIAAICVSLMDNKEVKDAVCSRLQFLFIDEFQDVDRQQFAIFEEIRKGKQTHIYAVGDPEQYISGYTYKGTSKPEFAKIPINTFKAERSKKYENKRAFTEIVNFTNQFHCELEQQATNGHHESAGVYFIDETELPKIIVAFRNLCSPILSLSAHSTPPIRFFYLSYENSLFEPVMTTANLSPITTDSTHSKCALDLALELIQSAIGMSQRKIQDEYRLDNFAYRRYGMQIVNAIQEDKISNINTLTHFVTDVLKLKPASIHGQPQNELLNNLIRQLGGIRSDSALHQVSSIHKAKGLEADAVLVVAKTKSELEAWLTTDKVQRANDKGDRCRIGFVGFTRAKILLSIACLQPIGVLKQRISDLGVKLSGNNQPLQASFDFGDMNT